MKTIAHIETPFREKFGVPRQAGLVSYEARVVFETDYRVAEAVRGLEQFDYIWLIWFFHKIPNASIQDAPAASQPSSRASHIPHSTSNWSPTVRPPRLGGNRRVGVFASRSPFRPNPIGLSCVRLLRVEPGPVLVVDGADLVDGTPILDIKPYVAYADSHPDARSGFAAAAPVATLQVGDPHNLLPHLPHTLRQPLVDTLSHDPRPHYQNDPSRIYTIEFDCYAVRFTVNGDEVSIEDIVLNNVNAEANRPSSRLND